MVGGVGDIRFVDQVSFQDQRSNIENQPTPRLLDAPARSASLQVLFTQVVHDLTSSELRIESSRSEMDANAELRKGGDEWRQVLARGKREEEEAERAQKCL